MWGQAAIHGSVRGNGWRSLSASRNPRRMLRECIESWLTPAPPWARALSLPREQAAIRARYRRHAAAWAPHLAATRAAMLDAAQGGDLAVVLGGGVLLDVPLLELRRCYRRVLIVDGLRVACDAARHR